jgi:CarD family transcriptional regulator
MFKVGDLVVYPAHGVCVIKSVESKGISGTTHEFYILSILGSDMTIMVPVNNVETVGLRGLISEETVPKIFQILKDKNMESSSQTWNRRYREYMGKIKTGCVLEIAAVLRDLYNLKVDKDLSFGERKMLDTAKNLLVREVSIVTKEEEAKVEANLDNMLSA